MPVHQAKPTEDAVAYWEVVTNWCRGERCPARQTVAYVLREDFSRHVATLADFTFPIETQTIHCFDTLADVVQARLPVCPQIVRANDTNGINATPRPLHPSLVCQLMAWGPQPLSETLTLPKPVSNRHLHLQRAEAA